MRTLIIIGASGYGKVVADVAQKLGVYEKIAFLDDADIKEQIGLPVLGGVDKAQSYLAEAEFIVAIGNAVIRRKIMEELFAKGAKLATLIHPSAVIGCNVKIGKGTVVMAGAVINPCATIGDGVIVNTCSSIDHDCLVEEYAHISVGARLAGNVKIGKNTWVGIGAVVKNNTEITSDCLIGASAVVVKDIKESGTYIGVPAKKKGN